MMMEVEKLLKTWLFSYSCQQRHTSALHVLAGDFARDPSPPAVLHVRLALSSLRSIVLDRMDYPAFHEAVAMVTDLFDGHKDVITYKEYAKVVTGLKTLALFYILKENQKLALPRLNLYYPRTGLKHTSLDRKLEARLSKAQRDFRKFFLSLIANRVFRDNYYSKEYDQEFGEDFQTRLQRLTEAFLVKIESKLPETEIQQLLRTGVDGPPCRQLSHLHHPYIELFLDLLYGTRSGSTAEAESSCTLTQAAVLEFVRLLERLRSGEAMARRQRPGMAARLMMQLDSQYDSESSQASLASPRPSIRNKKSVTEVKQRDASCPNVKRSPSNPVGNAASKPVMMISDKKMLMKRDATTTQQLATLAMRHDAQSTTTIARVSPAGSASPRGTVVAVAAVVADFKPEQSSWTDAPAVKISKLTAAVDELVELEAKPRLTSHVAPPLDSSEAQDSPYKESPKYSWPNDSSLDSSCKASAELYDTSQGFPQKLRSNVNDASGSSKNTTSKDARPSADVYDSTQGFPLIHHSVAANNASSSYSSCVRTDDDNAAAAAAAAVEPKRAWPAINGATTTYGTGRLYKMKKSVVAVAAPAGGGRGDGGGIDALLGTFQELQQAEGPCSENSSVIVISSGSNVTDNSKGSSEESASLLARKPRCVSPVVGGGGDGQFEDSLSLMSSLKSPSFVLPSPQHTSTQFQDKFINLIGGIEEEEHVDQEHVDQEHVDQEQVAIVSSSSSSSSSENTQPQQQSQTQRKRPLLEMQDHLPPYPDSPYPDSPSSHVVRHSENEDAAADTDVDRALVPPSCGPMKGRNGKLPSFGLPCGQSKEKIVPHMEMHQTPARLCVVKLNRDEALDMEVCHQNWVAGMGTTAYKLFS